MSPGDFMYFDVRPLPDKTKKGKSFEPFFSKREVFMTFKSILFVGPSFFFTAKYTRSLVLLIVLSALPVSAERIENPSIIDGEYVTAKDGHLSYRGRRVRFWGTHFCCGPKRSGRDLELSIDRMQDAGFNAIRFNLSHGLYNCGPNAEKVSYDVPKSTKGTKTSLNDLDYAIYLARRRGMFFWLQFCMGWGAHFTPADYDLMPDDGTREQWKEAIKQDPGMLVYVSDRAGRVQMEFAKRLLDHVNPYTGKRYGDEETIALWEMFNETLSVRNLLMDLGPNLKKYPKFIQDEVHAKWNGWLAQTYQNNENLKKAWGSLKPGESLAGKSIIFAPTPSPEGIQEFDAPGYQPEKSTNEKFYQGYPPRRCEDILRFYCYLYDDYNKRFMNHVRQFGKGIKVVSITPSGNCQRNPMQYYAASQYDFVATGTYGFACRPWEVGKTDPFIAYVNRHPLSGNLTDCMKVAGKPYLIYECNDYRPNPYMIEFPMYTALQLLATDGDGAFWFYWDDRGSFPKMQSDKDYCTTPLAMPHPAYPNAGLVLLNDEVMLAAIKSAGAIFRQADIPLPERTRVVIGKDRLFDITKPLLGEAEGWLRHFAWRTGVELVYDPNGPSKIPPCKDYDKPYCDLGQYVHFNWKEKDKGYIRIDAPTCKAQVGFNPENLTFGDTKVTGLNRKFTSVCMVAEDGKPLEKSESILITLVADSSNTGFQFDGARMKQQWAPGLAETIVNPGSAPVIVNRVSGTITAPWLKGKTVQRFNFGRIRYQSGQANGTLTVEPGEPMFYARVIPHQFRTIKKMVVAGNSITFHPPLANSDWNNHCGMGASSLEKDFAHQLHKFISEAQESKPELMVETFGDGTVVDSAQHSRFAKMKADLYVIEIGDNLNDDKCNEDTLGKPYEELLKAIKRANPNALIVCAGTWGGSKNKDRFMQGACAKQNVPFVRIDGFIGDPKNRATTFKHSGVAWHPSDAGMKHIADALWGAIQPQLQTQP
jgi:hypothetical protein